MGYTNISIHTPAGGVTEILSDKPCINSISIHTPAGGVTDSPNSLAAVSIDFNPHSRRGSDKRMCL